MAVCVKALCKVLPCKVEGVITGKRIFTPPFAALSCSQLPFHDSFLSSKAAFDVSFNPIIFFFGRGGREAWSITHPVLTLS